jgi:hypothetical protein
VTKRLLLCCAAMLAAPVGELGCQTPKLPTKGRTPPALSASARPAHTAGLSNEQINQGAKLFVAKCARCHPLYDPSGYSDVEWHSWMSKMTRKAHLKAEQEELLSRYLGAFRAP